MMGSQPFIETFKVHTYEVDLRNRLTTACLCQYLQEAASVHAESLGFGVSHLLQNNRTWILSRMLVIMDEYPKIGDSVSILTWPAGSEKVFYRRDFEVKNSTGKTVGCAVSYWIFMDLETRRPIHPRSGVIDYIPISLSGVVDRGPEKIGLNSRFKKIESFKVRFNDLDLNNHVNNIKYIEWILESVDPEIRKTHIVSELEINFLSEARYGDEVSVSIENAGSSVILHSVEGSSGEMCRGKTIWKK